MGSMVIRIVADGLLALGWEEEQGGGDEVGGLEDVKVAFGGVVALGAADDGLGGGVPGDFLEGEGMSQQILGKSFATCSVVGGEGTENRRLKFTQACVTLGRRILYRLFDVKQFLDRQSRRPRQSNITTTRNLLFK